MALREPQPIPCNSRWIRFVLARNPKIKIGKATLLQFRVARHEDSLSSPTRPKRELRRSYVRPTVCTNPGGNDVVYGFSYWYSDGYIYHTSPVGLYPCILGTS